MWYLINTKNHHSYNYQNTELERLIRDLQLHFIKKYKTFATSPYFMLFLHFDNTL